MRRRRLRRWTGGVDARYLEQRANHDGTVRRYWRRPSHDLVRLPAGPEWVATITRLNQAADAEAGPGSVVIEGTMAWAVAEYRASEEYEDLSKATKQVYDRWLDDFDERWGCLPAKSITRKVVVDFAKIWKDRPSTRIQAVAALRNVLEVARYHGYIDRPPTEKLRLKKGPKRRELWSWENIDAFSETARSHNHGDQAVIFLHLLLYTGQRPGDVLRMRRNHFDGDTIEVRQQKTGEFVKVPCHRDLRPVIEQAMSGDSMFLVSRPDGRPFKLNRMREVCAGIRKAAGLDHLQQRDLRRTAVVKLAEADCTTPQIGAITGHSIDDTEAILEVYLPRTLPMARAAIAKWEAHPRPENKNGGGTESNALDLTTP